MEFAVNGFLDPFYYSSAFTIRIRLGNGYNIWQIPNKP